MEADVDMLVMELVDKIRDHYVVDPHNPETIVERMPLLDFGRLTAFFTLDSISKVAFGEQLGFLTTESDPYGHLEMLQEMESTMSLAANIPYLTFITQIRWVQSLLKPSEPRGVYKILPFVALPFKPCCI